MSILSYAEIIAKGYKIERILGKTIESVYPDLNKEIWKVIENNEDAYYVYVELCRILDELENEVTVNIL